MTGCIRRMRMSLNDCKRKTCMLYLNILIDTLSPTQITYTSLSKQHKTTVYIITYHLNEKLLFCMANCIKCLSSARRICKFEQMHFVDIEMPTQHHCNNQNSATCLKSAMLKMIECQRRSIGHVSVITSFELLDNMNINKNSCRTCTCVFDDLKDMQGRIDKLESRQYCSLLID